MAQERPASKAPSVPALKPARVTLTLKDGRQATRSCDSPRGDCLNPYDEREIRQKFHELAGRALTPQGLDEVMHAVDGLERWPSGAVLPDLLRKHGRGDWR